MNKIIKVILLPISIAFSFYLFFGFLPSAFTGQIQINPVFINIGTFQLRWYGFLIALGILAAYFISAKELRKKGQNDSVIDSIIFVVVLSGIIGARLGFVLQSASSYFSSAHYLEIFKIWDGGLSIHGALIGGIIALYIYCAKTKLQTLKIANALTPPVFIAGAIGRWGNFFNSEIIGKPTTLPWKMYIAPLFRPSGFENISFFHPVFLYESLLLVLAYLIYVIFKKTLKQYAFTYTITLYSLIRIFVEFYRIDYKSIFLIFDLAQLVSIAIVLFGIGLYFYQKKSHSRAD